MGQSIDNVGENIADNVGEKLNENVDEHVKRTHVHLMMLNLI